jgi:hypothetical protein
VLLRQWTGHWFNRGYKGQRPYGVDSLYLNAQPWAILAGAATGRQAASVARSIGSLLSGPSPIGAASLSRSQGYGPAREKATGAGTTGGVWFALNGPDVWALGPVDPALAYREYKDNTRAAYAHAYPDNWFGLLSGPDSYNSFESPSAGQPSIPMYPVQDSLAPAWELFGTMAEAGIQATPGGYTIDPHWPFRDFTWDTGVAGVSYAAGGAHGYLRPADGGTVTMRVRAPAGTGPAPATPDGHAEAAAHRPRWLRAVDHARDQPQDSHLGRIASLATGGTAGGMLFTLRQALAGPCRSARWACARSGRARW